MLALLTLSALALAAAPSQAQHIVDVEGIAGHPTLQAAVDAASDGDTILVLRPNDPFAYVPGFVLEGKGLTIRGLGGHPVPVEPSVIRSIPESSTVVLHSLGFHVTELQYPVMPQGQWYGQRAQTSIERPGLEVVQAVGPVRIESSHLEGTRSNSPGLVAQFALDLMLIDTTVVGGSLAQEPSTHGLEARGSRIVAIGSRILGGAGTAGYSSFGDPQGFDGGDALMLSQRSFLWLGDSEVAGGDSPDVECIEYFCYPTVGNGGDVGTVDASSLVVTLQSTLRPGEGGEGTGGIASSTGEDGLDLVVFGQRVDVPGAQRRLRLPSERRSGEGLPIEVDGLPGEPVYIGFGASTAHRFLGPLFGVFGLRTLIGPGLVQVGEIPSSGTFVTTLTLPQVGATAPEIVHVQARCGLPPGQGSNNRYRLSETRSVLVSPDGMASPRPGEVIHVDPGRSGQLGRSWDDAFGSLASALGALPAGSPADSAGSEVWVAAGRYPAPQSGFLAPAGVTIAGGFQGTETMASEADPRTHLSIIDGDWLGDGSDAAHEADNSERLLALGIPGVYGPRPSVLSGLTLRSSRVQLAYPNWEAPVLMGGDTTILDCSFEDCQGDYSGALRHAWGDLRVDRCRFVGGQGGFATLVSRNKTGERTVLSNCLFAGNTLLEAQSTCLHLWGNATSGNVEHLVSNVTFVDNAVPYALYGVARAVGQAPFQNCLAWGNRKMDGTIVELEATPDWNLIEGVWQAAAPTFVAGSGPDGIAGTADDDWRLAAGSTGVDAGNNEFVPADAQFDLNGQARFRDDPLAPNTGVGGSRVVDIGAYER